MFPNEPTLLPAAHHVSESDPVPYPDPEPEPAPYPGPVPQPGRDPDPMPEPQPQGRWSRRLPGDAAGPEATTAQPPLGLTGT